MLDEEHPEQLVQRIIIFQPQDSLFIGGGEVQFRIKGSRDKIRFHLSRLRGQDADMRGQIVVDLHEADGNEPVEPGISYLF